MSRESSHPELIPCDRRKIPVREKPTLVALGNFDGVHLGHQRILSSLVEDARSRGLAPLLITFEPHPAHFFQPEKAPALLTTLDEKNRLLKKWPLEVICLRFTDEIAGLEPEEFVTSVLLETLNCREVFLGHDHRFGKGARGDADLLRRLLPGGEKAVHLAPPLTWDGEVVSSSAIRGHLLAGNLERANHLLGRPYLCLGEVEAGDGRGKELGFPTANIRLQSPVKLLPQNGVYGGYLEWKGVDYPAAINIGIRPTFDSQKTKLEVHVLDFKADIYGQKVGVKLLFHLRKEEKFATSSDLRQQIRRDVETCRERFSGADSGKSTAEIKSLINE